MSYEEEIIVLIAQLAMMKQRVYELRRRAMAEPVVGPKQHFHKQGSDELIRVLCSLTNIQVRLSAAQFSFATAKAVGE